MKHLLKIYCAIFVLLLCACSTPNGPSKMDGAPTQRVDVTKIPNATPKIEARSKYGNPSSYVIAGKRIYVLNNAKGYSKVGFASWYGTKFHGQLTSTRESYDMFSMTAASRDLPLPTYVQVTNLENGKSIIVKVNDRGPFVSNRIIDLSFAAAEKLGYANRGTTLVRVTAIDPVLWAKQHNNMPGTRALFALPSPHHFYLQVGAFASAENAEQLRQRITKLTQAPIQVAPTYRDHHSIYRVEIGPLMATESNQLREKLENRGISQTITVVG